MKFNLKTALLIDLVIIVFGILTPFFGQQIGDFFHPNPNKLFYKEINSDIDAIEQVMAPNDQSNQEKIDKEIIRINQKTINKSLDLYGVELSGKEDSLPNLEKVYESLYSKRFHEGDRTILAIYTGLLIKEKTGAVWKNDADLRTWLLLKSTKNEETVGLTDYIQNRKLCGGEPVTDFYNESVKKLGGE